MLVDIEHIHLMGVGRIVVHRIAAIGNNRQRLLLIVEAEHYGILHQIWCCLVVGVDVGLNEDKNTVVGAYLHITGNARSVTIDIDAEARGTTLLQSNTVYQQRLVIAVVDLHRAGHRGHCRKDRVERHGVLRKGQPYRTVSQIAFLFDTRREEQCRH